RAPRQAPGLPDDRAALAEPHRAGDAGAAQAAVAVRVLRQVLLVVVLGVVERAGRRDLGADRAVARVREDGLVRLARRLGGRTLLLALPVDRRAVPRTH